MPQTTFRVIIVGGGPIGLATGLALHASRIPFVILEKRDTPISDPGAGFWLLPHSLRFFDQIGILDQLEAKGAVAKIKENRYLDGKACLRADVFQDLETNHGYPVLVYKRKVLTEVLYSNLPDRETNMKINATVTNIEITESGVRVTLEDGTVECGSIVIGCDGAYSKTRSIARDLAEASGRKGLKGMELITKEQSLLGCGPAPEQGDRSVLYEARSSGKATQVIASDDTIWFAAVKSHPTPTMPRRKGYSPEETTAFCDEFADTIAFSDIPFREVMAKSSWHKLLDQEEGLSDIWSHNRIVLVGDSVVRMNSLTGQGFNLGLQCVITVVNGLNDILSNQTNPSTQSLEHAFRSYEAQCLGLCKTVMALARNAADGVTWRGWIAKVIDQYVFPLVGLRTLIKKAFSDDIIRHGRLLNSVPTMGTRRGNVKWTHEV